jgi:hypothetical protein
MRHRVPAAPQGILSPDNRKLLLVVVAVVAAIFTLVVSNVAANHAPKPHHVPVGVIGSPQVVGVVASQLRHSAPGAYQIHGYGSAAAARTAILHRRVYGAFRPGWIPLLLTASAASPSVSGLLQQTFAAAAGGQPNPLIVRDLAPLPSSDSRDATSFSAVLSLLFAGLLGPAIIDPVTQHRPLIVRLAAPVGLGSARDS